MSRLSEALTYLRKREGITQKELADRIGLTRSSIAMYEKGDRVPPFETLERIADFYNVSMSFLSGSDSEWESAFIERLHYIIETTPNIDQMAARLNLYRLNLIINRESPLSLPEAFDIADELGESMDYMLGRDNSATISSVMQHADPIGAEAFRLISRLDEDKKRAALDYLHFLEQKPDTNRK